MCSKVLYHVNRSDYRGHETILAYLRYLKIYDIYVNTIKLPRDNYSLVMPVFFACYDIAVYIVPVYYMKEYKEKMLAEYMRPVVEIAECEDILLAIDYSFADAHKYLQNMPHFVYHALKSRSFFKTRMLRKLARLLYAREYGKKSNHIGSPVQAKAYDSLKKHIAYMDDGYDYGLDDYKSATEHGANTFSFVHLLAMLFKRKQYGDISLIEQVVSYAYGQRILLTNNSDLADTDRDSAKRSFLKMKELFNGEKHSYFTMYKLFGKYIFSNGIVYSEESLQLREELAQIEMFKKEYYDGLDMPANFFMMAQPYFSIRAAQDTSEDAILNAALYVLQTRWAEIVADIEYAPAPTFTPADREDTLSIYRNNPFVEIGYLAMPFEIKNWLICIALSLMNYFIRGSATTS